MNEDTEARQESRGRTINVYVAGNTADEIELAALDEARAVFGADIALEIIRDYAIHGTASSSTLKESVKKYCASLKVRTVES